MTQEEQLKMALATLERFVRELAQAGGLKEAYAEDLWGRLQSSAGVLQELAYYHDYGKFLCGYQVAGYTLADIVVWQVDHFKAYMDRGEQMNRYQKERLLLESLDIMLRMEKDPAPYVQKMQSETGTDQKNP